MDLVIIGWSTGVKVISLINVLRKYKNISLRQAKDEVEQLLSGTPIFISGMDANASATAKKELESLGCVCR